MQLHRGKRLYNAGVMVGMQQSNIQNRHSNPKPLNASHQRVTDMKYCQYALQTRMRIMEIDRATHPSSSIHLQHSMAPMETRNTFHHHHHTMSFMSMIIEHAPQLYASHWQPAAAQHAPSVIHSEDTTTTDEYAQINNTYVPPAK